MAVNAVSSSTSSVQQLQQASQQRQAQQAEAAKPEDEAVRSRQVQQEANKPEQQPRPPVVNVQGQTTGQIVNITA